MNPNFLTMTTSCYRRNFQYTLMYDLDVVNEQSVPFFLICPNMSSNTQFRTKTHQKCPQIPKFADTSGASPGLHTDMEGQVGPVQHRVPPPAMFYFDWHRVKILKKVAGTEQTSMVAISTDESEVNWLISLRYPKYLISVLGDDGSIKGYARSGETRSSKHNMSHSQCWLQRTAEEWADRNAEIYQMRKGAVPFLEEAALVVPRTSRATGGTMALSYIPQSI